MAEHTDAMTEQPASEHGGGFPPFQKETFASQIVWLVVCFAILYAIVAKLVFPRMRAILAERSTRISDDLAEAARIKGEADDALAAYEQAIAEARGRGHALAAEAREKLNEEAALRRQKVDEELNAHLAEGERGIASSKAAAMSHVRGIAADTATAIVERLIGKTPSGPVVEAAVDDILKR